MTKNDLVAFNRYNFGYGSFEYEILEAWEKGNPEQKQKIEDNFFSLFKDNETKWRSGKEMIEFAAEGFYWTEDGTKIVEYYGHQIWSTGLDDSQDILETEHFYGPLNSDRIPPRLNISTPNDD